MVCAGRRCVQGSWPGVRHENLVSHFSFARAPEKERKHAGPMHHRPRRRAWPPPALLLLATCLHPAAAGAGPDMACIRNPAGRAGFNGGGGGVFESCTAAPALAPGAPAAFAWTLTPRDIADQRWDVELAVSVGRGDVDL